MSHVNFASSYTEHARPAGAPLPSSSSQFVYPSSVSRYAAQSPVGPAPTTTIRGLSFSRGDASVSGVYAGPLCSSGSTEGAGDNP